MRAGRSPSVAGAGSSSWGRSRSVRRTCIDPVAQLPAQPRASPSVFLAFPLMALRATTGPHWTALFPARRPETGRLMVVFAVLTLAVSFIAALMLSQLMDFTQNPVSDAMRTMTAGQFAGTLVATVPQLLGEELLAVLPFLAVLWLCVNRLGLSRRTGIATALVVSSLIFGAAHLPTYGWNWRSLLSSSAPRGAC